MSRGLFGWLPHISGGEFEQEDAIVNQFHPEETAKVELIFENPQTKFKTIRTRRKSRWSRRKSSLTLEFEDVIYKGREAEEKTRALIGLTEDEFYAGIYLHQEVLREFITGDIDARNAVIDKLLGTYSLREIVESLPVSKLKRITNELGERIQNLKAAEFSRLPAARSKLKEQKKELDSRKTSKDELQLGKLSSSLNNVRIEIEALADELDVQIDHLKPPQQDLITIQKAVSMIRKNVSNIETKRFQRYGKLVDRIALLKSSKDKMDDLRNKIERLEDAHQPSIREKIEDSTGRIRSNRSRQKEFREKMDFLHSKKIDLSKFSINLKVLLEREEKIVSGYENLEGIKMKLTHVDEEATSLRDSINKMEAYNQLITQAVEYVEKHNPDACPVCKSKINPLDLAENLHHEISKTEDGTKILKLTHELNEKNEEKRKLQTVQTQLEDLKSKIDETRSNLQECKHDILEHTELTKVDTNIMEDYITKLKSKLDELTSSIDEMTQEKFRLESVYSEYERLKASLLNLSTKIKSELMIEKDASVSQAISKKLKDDEKKQEKFNELNLKLQNFLKDIERLEQILAYLLMEAEVLRLEEEFPELEALLRSEINKYDKLTKLRDGLIQIRQAALEEQRSFITHMLKEVESDINLNYQKLMGHSYYTNISLTCETQRNKNIYWIKAKGADYETHVRTRFSNTQLNATAIAIFNSVSKRLPHNLNLVIFDDPFQSMDQHRQNALIEKLTQDAKERQVIIATHNNVILKRLENSISPGETMKITGWSAQGPQIG